MRRPPAIGSVQLSAGTPRVVAAGGEAELDALTRADGADVVELRADLFEDPRPETIIAALARLRSAGRLIILTVRAAAEGGRPLDETRRSAIYVAGLPHADAIDVEIASASLSAELLPRARAAHRMVILSAHAFDAMPSDEVLQAAIARGAELGADVMKIAAVATDVRELQCLLAVSDDTEPLVNAIDKAIEEERRRGGDLLSPADYRAAWWKSSRWDPERRSSVRTPTFRERCSLCAPDKSRSQPAHGN